MSNNCYYSYGAINYKNGFVTTCPQQSDQLHIVREAKTIKPSEILNSAGFKQHRKDMIDGKWSVGCYLCRDVEANNAGKSMRQDYPAKLDNLDLETGAIDYKGLNHVELRFSNACNFACLHCSEVYSSNWTQKLKDYVADEEDYKHNILQLTKRMHRTSENDDLSMGLSMEEMESIVTDLNENFPNIEKIDFAGGEVLYQKQFMPCLELLGKHPNASNITICFHSNFNTKFDPVRLHKLLSVFGKVTIMISVDAGKNIYPYFRGGNWDVLTNNMEAFKSLLGNKKNIEVNLVCTTSAYQIMDIENIFESFLSVNADWLNSSIAYTPFYMNPAVLMHEFKDYVIEDIAAARRVIDRVKEERYANFEQNKNMRSWRESMDCFSDIKTAYEALENIETYIYNTETQYSDYETFLIYIRKADKIWKQNFNDYFTKYQYVDNKLIRVAK